MFLACKLPLTSQQEHAKMSWRVKAPFIVKEGNNYASLNFFPSIIIRCLVQVIEYWLFFDSVASV